MIFCEITQILKLIFSEIVGKDKFCMFWDNFLRLCEKANKSPNAVGADLGYSSGSITAWKQGRVPKWATVSKIADYFGVTTDYLLGTTDQKEKPSSEDEELTEYLEELKTRPEMKMLFSLAKGATKEDVERAVAIIEALRKKENG